MDSSSSDLLNKKLSKKATLLTFLGVSFVLMFVFLAFIASDYEPDISQEAYERRQATTQQKKQKTGGTHDTEAFICAKNYIKKNLKAPSTAKFPFFPPGVEHLQNETYAVRIYVDAQNSFGAMIRTDFICEVNVLDASNFKCDVSCATL